MKKVVNINIGGVVVPMEEGALDALQAFMTNLRHINDDKINREEILANAEQNAAMAMQGILAAGAAVITESDIDTILESMRNPPQQLPQTVTLEANLANEEGKLHLHRNMDDMMLGGVCSGFAHYFNVDPSIIRVLFAVFALSGWVALAYVVLWVVVPAKKLGPYSGKRLYRDISRKVLGGVAGGISNYFGWDVTIVRLAFLAPLILSIIFGVFAWPFFFVGNWLPNFLFQGSMTGTFFLTYILLWIILPPEGEESIAHSFGSLARVLLYLVAGIAVFATFVALIAALVVGTTKWPKTALTWADGWQQLYASGTLFLFLGVPLLAMLVWIFQRMSGWDFGAKYLRWVFAVAWGLGCLSFILFIASLFKACPSLS